MVVRTFNRSTQRERGRWIFRTSKVTERSPVMKRRNEGREIRKIEGKEEGKLGGWMHPKRQQEVFF